MYLHTLLLSIVATCVSACFNLIAQAWTSCWRLPRNGSTQVRQVQVQSCEAVGHEPQMLKVNGLEFVAVAQLWSVVECACLRYRSRGLTLQTPCAGGK